MSRSTTTLIDSEDPPTPRARRGFFGAIGGEILDLLQVAGESAYLLFGTISRIGFGQRTWARTMEQMVRVGTDTVPLACLVSLFIGMVLVVQTADQLERFTQEIIGSIVGLAMTKELGPVVMGFLLAGRVGSAVAAEIGSMKVSDEINALRTMDIDPIRFLSVPRFLAMTFALPMLIVYSDIVGIAGGALVVAADPTLKISVGQYFDNLTEWINFTDIMVGLIKGTVFGMIIAVMSCTFGFRTTGGAEGVARSTTAAVVWSFVLIIIFDYLIVRAAIVLS